MANTARRSTGREAISGATYASKYLDFVTGYSGNLTGTVNAISQSDGNTAASSTTLSEIQDATLNANAINTVACDGSGAASVMLPAAVAGTHTCAHITGDIDQTGAVTFEATDPTVGTTGKYAWQVLQPENGYGSAQAVITAGTAAAPTSTNMIYTAAAADTNFLGVGSLVHFFCIRDGQWMVKIFNIKEGTGATGTITVS